MNRGGPLKELEEALGHSFANSELLTRALTHGSAPGARPGCETYQRLEFLGDRVLGLVIADMLDERFPEAPEGELSRRLARLVSRETCTEVARDMQLGKYVRIGGSVEKGGGRATAGVLADACEAVLGALYRDGGLAAARGPIERYWRPRVESMSGALRDAKTELQEWAHRRGFATPVYAEVLRFGPDHAPEFEVEVVVAGADPGRGRGRSKREAEHAAAALVLRREGVWGEG
jgi:ribonuclease-3